MIGQLVADDQMSDEQDDEQTEFKFAELSDEAKDRAIAWMGELNCSVWEPEWDHQIEALGYLGFEIFQRCSQRTARGVAQPTTPDIGYSFGGNDNEVDFDGKWTANDMDLGALQAHSNDETLLGFFPPLMAVLLKHPGITARITRAKYAPVTCSLGDEVDRSGMTYEESVEQGALVEEADELLKPIVQGIFDWMCKIGQEDYEWQYDRDRCIEDIEANDYTFDETGVVL